MLNVRSVRPHRGLPPAIADDMVQCRFTEARACQCQPHLCFLWGIGTNPDFVDGQPCRLHAPHPRMCRDNAVHITHRGQWLFGPGKVRSVAGNYGIADGDELINGEQICQIQPGPGWRGDADAVVHHDFAWPEVIRWTTRFWRRGRLPSRSRATWTRQSSCSHGGSPNSDTGAVLQGDAYAPGWNNDVGLALPFARG